MNCLTAANVISRGKTTPLHVISYKSSPLDRRGDLNVEFVGLLVDEDLPCMSKDVLGVPAALLPPCPAVIRSSLS